MIIGCCQFSLGRSGWKKHIVCIKNLKCLKHFGQRCASSKKLNKTASATVTNIIRLGDRICLLSNSLWYPRQRQIHTCVKSCRRLSYVLDEVRMQELKVDLVFQECPDTAEATLLHPCTLGSRDVFFIKSRSVWPNVQYWNVSMY